MDEWEIFQWTMNYFVSPKMNGHHLVKMISEVTSSTRVVSHRKPIMSYTRSYWERAPFLTHPVS